MMLKRLSELFCFVFQLYYTECFHSNNNTDYTPALVELICHLGDGVAMVAVQLLIDCAQLMGIPTKDSQKG